MRHPPRPPDVYTSSRHPVYPFFSLRGFSYSRCQSHALLRVTEIFSHFVLVGSLQTASLVLSILLTYGRVLDLSGPNDNPFSCLPQAVVSPTPEPR